MVSAELMPASDWRQVAIGAVSAGEAHRPRLSADGTRLAFVADDDGVWAAYVTATLAYRPRRLGTPMDDPVSAVELSADGRLAMCQVAPAGSMRTQLYVASVDGTPAEPVFTDPTATAFVGRWSPAGDGHLYTVSRDASSHTELWRYDSASGETTLLADGDALLVSDVSPDGSLVAARSGPRGYRRVVLIDLATQSVRPLHDTDDGCSYDGRFTADGRQLLIRTDVGATLHGLAVVDITAGADSGLRWLATREDADLDCYALASRTGQAVLAWNLDGRTELELLDLHDGHRRRLVTATCDVVGDLDVDGDATRVVLDGSGPGCPRDLWFLDPSGGDHRVLRRMHRQPARGNSVPTMLRLRARDGLPLSGWLYRPVGPLGPLPTVISLHGGPEAQERPVFTPLYQALVAAGFPVFAPNVRGSTGFGREFLHADDGPLRRAAITDVADCAAYLVEADIAAPGRVGVHGASYGGYLVLSAATQFPDLFSAGVSMCGVANFETFFAGTEPWMAAASVTEYGDPVSDRELLRALSPVHQLAALRTPLLLQHGANDTNVPPGESQQVADALRDTDVPVQHTVYADEGHSLARRDNRTAAVIETVEWFTRWL
jgi:dipeptidyl aminopeptidase/acylaminoacyl peptidase